MNEVELESFPFDSIIDDREYEASIFRNYFGKFLSSGVYFGLYNNYGDYSMKVVPDTGLNVKVTKGCGLIKGADYNLKDDKVLNINMPIGSARNDMIVVRLDDKLEVRKTKLYVKEGTSTDFATLERTTDVYEICLAKIVVGDRVLAVTADDITDTRRDSELCGIVTSLIDIDIQDVLDDITAKKDQFFIDLGIETEEEKTAFFNRLEAWFQSLQDILDENTAANLLNLINANTQAINNNTQAITANTPVYYTLTLASTGWVQNATTQKYEYDVVDESITKDHHISCNMSIENQEKLANAEGDSYNGGFTIRTTELPESDITMDITIQKMTKRVTTTPETPTEPATPETPTEGGDTNENEV